MPALSAPTLLTPLTGRDKSGPKPNAGTGSRIFPEYLGKEKTVNNERRTQDCTRCRKPSLPGLMRGKGLCQFHWNEAVWGREWAERCRAEDEEA